MRSLCLALLLAQGAHAGEYATFYSADKTYLVDVDAAQLLVARDWITVDDGRPTLYRLQTHAARPQRRAGTPRKPASRWTVLQRARPGDSAWTPVVKAPPLGPDPFQDETMVLQFTGRAVSLARLRRTWLKGSAAQTTQIGTLALPSAERLHTPAAAQEALDWFSHQLPELAPAGRMVGVVDRELFGGQRAAWLMTQSSGGTLNGIALDTPTAPRDWVAPTKPAPKGLVVDERQGPSVRLRLEGPRPSAERPIVRTLAFDSPCTARKLSLIKGQKTLPLGEVARLDGLRWLTHEDPLLTLKDSHFVPVSQATHTQPAKFAPTGIMTAHHARINDEARPWGGLADLSAAVGVKRHEGWVLIDIQVTDRVRQPGDQVRLWIAERGTRLDILPGGAIESRRRDRSRAQKVLTRWIEREGGYRLNVDIPSALLGDPPSLTVRIDDADAPSAETIYLWAAGHPVDRRRTSATLIEGHEAQP